MFLDAIRCLDCTWLKVQFLVAHEASYSIGLPRLLLLIFGRLSKHRPCVGLDLSRGETDTTRHAANPWAEDKAHLKKEMSWTSLPEWAGRHRMNRGFLCL
jgi:hypothetical protein